MRGRTRSGVRQRRGRGARAIPGASERRGERVGPFTHSTRGVRQNRPVLSAWCWVLGAVPWCLVPVPLPLCGALGTRHHGTAPGTRHQAPGTTILYTAPL